jgi:hypothetical protein
VDPRYLKPQFQEYLFPGQLLHPVFFQTAFTFMKTSQLNSRLLTNIKLQIHSYVFRLLPWVGRRTKQNSLPDRSLIPVRPLDMVWLSCQGKEIHSGQTRS